MALYPPPSLTLSPAPQSVISGSALILSAIAQGTPAPLYQWIKDGSLISGATLSTYSLEHSTVSDSGSYQVIAWNINGTVTSGSASVTILEPPEVTLSTGSLTLNNGDSLTLSASVTGTPPFTFQWRKNGSPITDGTTASLSILSVQPTDTGSYDVLVSNVAGTTTSASSQVYVNPALTIISQPASLTALPGSQVTFSVTASGNSELFYQWYKDGIAIHGATQRQYTISTMTQTFTGVYHVSVRDFSTEATSARAALTLDQRRGIFVLNQPCNTSLLAQTNARIPVTLHPALERTLYDRYQIYHYENGKRTSSVGPIGSIPYSGAFNLPLKDISTSGTYVVLFIRLYADRRLFIAESTPFHVTLDPWDGLTGTYQALLETTDSSLVNLGEHRGQLSVCISKGGATSGKIFYEELAPNTADTAGLGRIYQPIRRTIAGTFSLSDGSPNVLVLSTKIPSRQESVVHDLELTLDCSNPTPTMRAVFTDQSSFKKQDNFPGLVSVSQPFTRSLVELPDSFMATSPRQLLSTNSSSDEPAFFLNTITRYGKMLWVNRTRKGPGSGASSLMQVDEGTLSGILFENSATNAEGLGFLSTTLGRFELKQIAPGNWCISYGRSGDRALEQHVSYALPRSTNTLQSGLRNLSRLRRFEFDETQSSDWATAWLPSNLNQLQSSLRFLLSEPVEDLTHPPPSYEWALQIAANGAVNASGVRSRNGLLPPPLRLRFNAQDGTFSGFYFAPPKNTPRLIFGSVGSSIEHASLGARGWVQPHHDPLAPFGVWTIEQVPSAP